MSIPSYELNIFNVLRSISTKQLDGYKNIPDNIKNKFVTVVVSRWLSGTNDPYALVKLNETVLPYIFSLYQYPELLYFLMVSSIPERHNKKFFWVKRGSTNKSVNIRVEIVSSFYKISTKQAKTYVSLLNFDDFVEMAKYLGMDDKEYMNKLKNECNLKRE